MSAGRNMARARSRGVRFGWIALALCAATAAASAPVVDARLEQLPQRWRDDDGRTLELRTLSGQRVVLTMVYAGCHRFCPITMARLQHMQMVLDARGQRADFVVIGYEPEAEMPADWHSYRAGHHLERRNWHFLSGSRADTERLARQLGFDFWKYDEHVMHGMRALVFDERGAVQAQLGPETQDWAEAL